MCSFQLLVKFGGKFNCHFCSKIPQKNTVQSKMIYSEQFSFESRLLNWEIHPFPFQLCITCMCFCSTTNSGGWFGMNSRWAQTKDIRNSMLRAKKKSNNKLNLNQSKYRLLFDGSISFNDIPFHFTRLIDILFYYEFSVFTH